MAESMPQLVMPDKAARTKLFRAIDVNGNGGLSLAEIDKAVVSGEIGKAMNCPDFNHKPAIMRAYKAADTDGDAFIERREFGKLLKYIVYFNNLWHKFEEIDSDHDRRLNPEEFAHGCSVVGMELSAEDAAAEFSKIDTDGGGYILFVEFCKWCVKRHVGEEDDEVGAAPETMGHKAGHKAGGGAKQAEEKEQPKSEPIPQLVMPDKAARTKLFRAIDVNGNGGLSLAEIDKAVVSGEIGKAMNCPDFNHKPAIMRAYKAADTDGDAFIERREFGKLLKYIVYFNNLWHKFEEIDSDHDRRLNPEEFAHGCSVVGMELSAEDAAAEFSKIDTDGGGYILFVEFCKWCVKRHVGEEDDEVGAAPETMGHKAGHKAGGGAKQAEEKEQPKSEPIPQLVMPDKAARTKLFRAIDVNGNGGLSLAEIDKAVVSGEIGKAMNCPDFNHKPAIMRAYKAADTDGDAFIERREFGKLLKYIVYFNNLWHKFEEIDSDHDRRLNPEEFAHGCSVVGMELSAEDAAAEFSKIDTDGGGYILFVEFCKWCVKRHVGEEDDEVGAQTASAEEGVPPEQAAEPEAEPDAA